jgi:hypothetical protein
MCVNSDHDTIPPQVADRGLGTVSMKSVEGITADNGDSPGKAWA